MASRLTGTTNIKIQNPHRLERKNQSKILQTGKAKVEKESGLAQDSLDVLKAKNKDGQHKSILEEGAKHQSESQKWVVAARKLLATLAAIEAEDSGADEAAFKDHTDLISTSIKFGSVHQEGLKQFKLRMQSLLGWGHFCRA